MRKCGHASLVTIQRTPTLSQSGHSLTGDLRSVCDVWLSNMKTSLSSSLSRSDVRCLSADQGEASRGAPLLSTEAFGRIWKDGDDDDDGNGWQWIISLIFRSLQRTHTAHSVTKIETLHSYSNNWVPEGQGTSVGALWGRNAIPYCSEQASSRGSLARNVGGKGCTASSEYLLSWPITCCTDWPLSVLGWECGLKETLDGPCWWVLLLLTRNDRGMAGWWLGELMGGKVKKKKILQHKLVESEKSALWCCF